MVEAAPQKRTAKGRWPPWISCVFCASWAVDLCVRRVDMRACIHAHRHRHACLAGTSCLLVLPPRVPRTRQCGGAVRSSACPPPLCHTPSAQGFRDMHAVQHQHTHNTHSCCCVRCHAANTTPWLGRCNIIHVIWSGLHTQAQKKAVTVFGDPAHCTLGTAAAGSEPSKAGGLPLVCA